MICLAASLVFAPLPVVAQTIHHYLVLRAPRGAAINAWLHNHPMLDLRGGGNRTFETVSLVLTSAPDECQPGPDQLEAFGASWKMSVVWRDIIRNEILARNWKVNTTDANNDYSDYSSQSFTWAEALADTTRKPSALKVCTEPIP